MRKLVLGCGYVGERVARRWKQGKAEVHVVTRSLERADELSRQGFHPVIADVTRPETFPELPESETILYAIGFDRQAGNSMRAVYVEGLRTALQHLRTPPNRLIYLSSTGVFGEHPALPEGTELPANGEPPSPISWTDETSPCHPTREGGVVCLEAENVLRAHSLASRLTILRLAGIYGPGRIPRRDQVVSGQGLAVPQSGCINLIHVEDAVRVILAAEAKPEAAGEIYVVSDGHPVERVEYYAELARCYGASPPKLLGAETESPVARRTGGSKRLSNAKMLRDLQIELQYPSYREGLAELAG